MDSYRDHPSEFEGAPVVDGVPENGAPVAIGNDERRMHVRAYNYWVSLLDGREFPSIDDIVSGEIEDFGPYSVIVDLTGRLNNPATPYVGSAIKSEIGVDTVTCIADVPGRSLLSRLTDHHFQIIATRAPVGFEAEFTNQRGHDIFYRGILMPFSSDGDAIDFVYGVINWKDMGLSSQPQTPLRAALPSFTAEREDEQEILDLLRAEEDEYAARQERKKAVLWPQLQDDVAPVAPPVLPDFALSDDADGDDFDLPPGDLDPDAGLADRLCAARDSAEICKAADGRSRAALYRALALAYDFAVAAKRVPDDYAEILEDAGVKGQARAPMTPVVKLVFGADYDKARLTEFAAALSFAERGKVDFGGFEAFVAAADGGLKGLVAAERKARRPDAAVEPDKSVLGRAALRAAPPIALKDLATNAEFALVLTRRNAAGVHEAVGLVSDPATLERLIRRAAD